MEKLLKQRVDAQFAQWALDAWKQSNNDWALAQENFLKLRDADFPGLGKAMRDAMEDEVWRLTANDRISRIVTNLRKKSRRVTAPPPVVVKTPTGRKTRRTLTGSIINKPVHVALFLDEFFLSSAKVALRFANYDQIEKEAGTRLKQGQTRMNDAKMLEGVLAKMRAAGAGHGDTREAGTLVTDNFVQKLHAQIY